MIIHGKKLTTEEVKNFVKQYKRNVEQNANSRYCQLIKLIDTRTKIIDVGCGWGIFAKMMEEKGNSVLGIDNSENEIEICKTVWGDTESLRFESKDIREMENESYECVVSTQVIEHVHNPGNYLDQCNRLLINGGLLVISLPNIMNPRYFVAIKGKKENVEKALITISKRINMSYIKSRDHIHAWDPRHFVNLVSTMGFILNRFEPMEGIPMPSSKFFPKYIRSNFLFKIFGTYCYTMAFVFEKIKNSSIGSFD